MHEDTNRPNTGTLLGPKLVSFFTDDAPIAGVTGETLVNDLIEAARNNPQSVCAALDHFYDRSQQEGNGSRQFRFVPAFNTAFLFVISELAQRMPGLENALRAIVHHAVNYTFSETPTEIAQAIARCIRMPVDLWLHEFDGDPLRPALQPDGKTFEMFFRNSAETGVIFALPPVYSPQRIEALMTKVDMNGGTDGAEAKLREWLKLSGKNHIRTKLSAVQAKAGLKR